jgi:hypothetical protein
VGDVWFLAISSLIRRFGQFFCWKKFPEKNPHKEKEKGTLAFMARAEPCSTSWIVDLGATKHTTCDIELLTDYKAFKASNSVSGIAGVLEVIGEGNVSLSYIGTDGETRIIKLSGVQYTPNAYANLLSVPQLQKNGVDFSFPKSKDETYGRFNGIGVFHGTFRSGVYRLRLENQRSYAFHATMDELVLWHSRFGHLNYKVLCGIHKYATGVPKLSGKGPFCDPCIVGKHHRTRLMKRPKLLLKNST